MSNVEGLGSIYIVRTSLARRDDEPAWNDWYNTTHIADMLTVPGVRSATRFADVRNNGEYLALYDVDSPSVFEHPRYAEVRGWHEWAPHVRDYTRIIANRVQADETFSS